eukprot:EG_transcript_7596
MVYLSSPSKASSYISDTSSILGRRRSLPTTEIRYFPESHDQYQGPRYTYEDGVLRRYTGSQSVTASPSKVVVDNSLAAPYSSVTVAKPASFFLAHNDYEAAQLDAADGVIDGAHYGTPIYRKPESGAVVTPKYYVAHDPAQATRLDAADGVLDGKYYGAQIYSRGGTVASVTDCCTPEVNRSYVVARTPTDALRLDAADGVLDGAHYGAPIVSRPAIVSREIIPLPPTVPVTCVTPQYSTPSVVTTTTPSVVTTTRTVERHNPYAEQFLDLRAHLERDRLEFEQTKAREKQDLAIREARLQLEKERIELERERLRAETARLRAPPSPHRAPKPMPVPAPGPSGTIKVQTRQEAERLDMKDGIIDGKYNGVPIEVVGQGLLRPPPHLMGKRINPNQGKGNTPQSTPGSTPNRPPVPKPR